MSETIYLVSCVGKKREYACAARDLYVSELFHKARQTVEATGCRWFILSAEHGLLSPDQLTAPYDRTLNKMKIADRRLWGNKTARQLLDMVPDVTNAVFLAGEKYREFLVPGLVEHGVNISVPMQGLFIGQQLNWLKNRAFAGWQHRL